MKTTLLTFLALPLALAAAPRFTPVGDWSLRVECDGIERTFDIDRPALRRITAEPVRLRPWNPNAWEQARGTHLKALGAQECSVAGAIAPQSVKVSTPDGSICQRGVDWEMDEKLGIVGYLKGGRLEQNPQVLVDYAYRSCRIDAIVRSGARLELLRGKEQVAVPAIPDLGGKTFLGTVYLYAGISRLDAKALFPKLEEPSQAPRFGVGAIRFTCPRTYEKLLQGERVKILAWGDSVTECGYLPDRDKWQNQFVRRLRERFSKADIELVSNGWGGRRSIDFLNAPQADTNHNFNASVLAHKPDLVISEFINDTGMSQKEFDRTYESIRRAFGAQGIEWIILSPHFSKPEWMGASSSTGCRFDADARDLIKRQEAFVGRHNIARAVPGLRWGHLWREGRPYLPLLVNNINHPDAEGMGFFADALMDLFEVSSDEANPCFPGWYADPQIRLYGSTYWIYPTTSRPFSEQTYLNCFSSKDLRCWTRHKNILSADQISWAHAAIWAPDAVEKDGRYYLFFSANDPYPVESDSLPNLSALQGLSDPTPRPFGHAKYGGIGVAVADRPEGPYRDLIGKPLIDRFWNGAQPIDQCVFRYEGSWYMVYGGWGRCNLVRLADDFKSLVPFPDGALWKPFTPKEYTEGSVLFERKGRWYFMYSHGNWTDASYRVNYSVGASPLGPFEFKGAILTNQPEIATGAGHHSVFRKAGTDDEWYICYHRRPVGGRDGNHREVCIDRLIFNEQGDIIPVKMSR
ncbi:MAG: family 43 glycosylhydrolase [Kiritimatiellia bacterium]